MANHIENLSQFLQSFGVAAPAFLFLPVLIAVLARNITLALAASLLSFTSLMLFIAPASANSGLALVSGLGSFLVALESVFARGRMVAFNKQVADLTSRVNQLEGAEQRRLVLEVKARGGSFQKEEEQDRTAKVEEALLANLELMPPEEVGPALIGLAALKGWVSYEVGMAAVRTKEGRAAALDWLQRRKQLLSGREELEAAGGRRLGALGA
jgi:hypothetical protein